MKLKSTICLVLSAILIVATVFSVFTSLVTVNAESKTTEVWNGSVATAFSGGDGTKDNPYQIATASELAYLCKTVSNTNSYSNTGNISKANYKLMNDIELNNTLANNWYEGQNLKSWYYSNNKDNAFNGHFDGDGHTIKGLYVNRDPNTTSDEFIGLFTSLGTSAVVEKVKIDKSYMRGKYVGAITGGVSNNITVLTVPTVKLCQLTDFVILSGSEVAGIMAWGGKSLNVESCLVSASISGSAKAGAFFADTWTGPFTVTDSYSTSNVAPFGHQAVSGVKSYTVSTGKDGFKHVDLEKMIGLKAFDEMELNESVWVAVESMTPQLRIFYNGYVPPTFSGWDGSVATSFSGGDGTKDNPYQISKASELAYLCKTVSLNNTFSNNNAIAKAYYVLTKDIELNDTSSDKWFESSYLNSWFYNTEKDNSFNGYFNGQGHTISGLYINRDAAASAEEYAGLFTSLGKDAVIENLQIDNSYIKAKYVSAISGTVSNNITETNIPTVRRCQITSNVKLIGLDVGGILAWGGKSLDVVSCYVGAQITATNKSGAFFANTWTGPFSVTDSYSTSNAAPYGHQAVSGTKSYTVNNPKEGFSQVSLVDIKGLNAFDTMDLDKNVWVALEDDLPQIKFFVNGYSNVENEKLNDKESPEDGYDKTYWDGKPSIAYAGGNGSKSKPYEISNAAELAKLCMDVKNSNWTTKKTSGKYYLLTKDIVINNIYRYDWQEHAIPWYTGDDNCTFNGVLDGKGHTISGIFIDEKKDNLNGGLFISIGEGAVIKSVGLENSYIKATRGSAGFAGSLDNKFVEETPQIIACYCGEGVTIVTDTMFAGGFIGRSPRPATLRYCYFLGNVYSTTPKDADNYPACDKFVGGLVGGTWSQAGTTGGDIKYRSCYSAPANGEKLVGEVSPACKATNTYAINNRLYNSNEIILSGVKELAIERMLGEEAKEFMTFDFDNIWYCEDGKTPQLRVFKYKDAVDPETFQDPFERKKYDGAKAGDIWTGAVATKFDGGKGTKSDPYQIATAEQLAYFVDEILLNSAWNYYPSAGKYYVLTADIYLNDVSNEKWYQNENLNHWFAGNNHSQAIAGNFNGNGHVVYGLFFDEEDAIYASLFPSITYGGVIENLGVVNSFIYNEGSYASAIVAYVENRNFGKKEFSNEPIIRQCFVGEDVTIHSGTQAGGILCGLPTTICIEDCYVLASIEAAERRNGGIIGYSWYNGVYKSDDTGEIMRSHLKNCYVCNVDKNPAVGKLSYDFVDGENVYILTNQGGIATTVSFSNITDEKAKTTLVGFDFENIWNSVAKSTPILRVFENQSHSDTSHFVRLKGPVTIKFETYGGTEISPISGESGTPLELPTKVVRDVDVFDGWYLYDTKTYDIPFVLNYFPDDDTVLYAKWIIKGSNQDFEYYQYSESGEDGIDEDYELYRLGVFEYNIEYVHGGVKSLHRRGLDSEYQVASLANLDTVPLVVGSEYKVSMWVYVKDCLNDSDNLMIAYLKDADWAFDVTATQNIALMSSIPKGSWQQLNFKLVAADKYLGIATPGNTEMFIDDVVVVPTGKSGLVNNKLNPDYIPSDTIITSDTVTEIQPVQSNNGTNNRRKMIIRRRKKKPSSDDDLWIYITIAGGVILLIGGATAFIIVRRKKRKKA